MNEDLSEPTRGRIRRLPSVAETADRMEGENTFIDFGSPKARFAMGLSMTAGHMALMRMPRARFRAPQSFRYYSSRLGRFLSTDALGGSVGSLQSHNAYLCREQPCEFHGPVRPGVLRKLWSRGYALQSRQLWWRRGQRFLRRVRSIRTVRVCSGLDEGFPLRNELPSNAQKRKGRGFIPAHVLPQNCKPGVAGRGNARTLSAG
jgi:hypothetical protein